MSDETKPKCPRLDRFSLLNALWRHALVVSHQRWIPQSPEYPGHDSGRGAAVWFGVLPIGDRVLVLSNQNFDDSGYEDLPIGKRPSRVCILGKVRRKWSSVKKRIDRNRYDGWKFTWLFDDLPDVDGTDIVHAAVAQAAADQACLRDTLAALGKQILSTQTLLRGKRTKGS